MLLKSLKNVDELFDMIVDKISDISKELKETATKFLSDNEYENSKLVVEKVKKIDDFCNSVKNLEEKWSYVKKELIKNINITKSKKLKKGLRTPTEEFIYPILEALLELGGTAKAKDIIVAIEEKQ